MKNPAVKSMPSLMVKAVVVAIGLSSFVAPVMAQDASPQGASPQVASPQDASPQVADYKIGPKDLVEIRVIEIPELNVERRVSENGTLDLPLIGPLSINGLSTTEAARKLADLLTAQYVNRANVSVVVKEFANKPLSILGAVAHPGSLNISGRYSLLQAISAAGGLTENAGKKIYVIRTAENGISDTIEIKVDDLFRSANAKWNIPVLPSDVVNIPARRMVKVFCIGEVKTPGALEFDSDDRISLLSVLAKAGGLTDRASKKITITRHAENGHDTEMVVDYKDIISQHAKDPELMANDMVIVKQSFF
ncbi:MAG: polysaccharide biosynthesis/export family protein [Acidobacteriota bacterium]